MIDKLLDPTLIGVIFGSFLSLAGNSLTQHLVNKKEERQWKRQRESLKEEREESLKSQEIEYLRELYHKCILSLSVYISSLQDNKKDEEGNQSDIIKEIHHWLSLLLLRHPHSNLNRLINSFLSDPDEFEAEQLRKYTLELVQKEDSLFISNPFQENFDKSAINEKKPRIVTFHINDDYRKQQMVLGIELPKSHSYEYEFGELTNMQRDRLLKVNFPIPDSAQLYLPLCWPGAKQLSFQGKAWEAQINPKISNINEILDQWVIDFDKKLYEAEQVLAQNNQTNA